MTDSPTIKRNALYNLLGAGVPMLAAVISIPWLMEGLGAARFGLLTISWAILGYFSLFDIGIGRAVTQSVARRLETEAWSVSQTLWTGLMLAFAMGTIGGLALAASAPSIAGFITDSSPWLFAEARTALTLLASCVPVLTVSNTLRGFLEAHQRFDLVNAVRVPINVITFVGPLAVLPYSNGFDDLVIVLIGARLCSLIAYLVLAARINPDIRRPNVPDRACVRELISFGGWLTVTNTIGPILVYADRFAIAGLISSAALAFYVTPWEVVTRLMIVPGALMSALFPAISAAHAVDRDKGVGQLRRANRYVALFIFPVTLLLVVFGEQGLDLWVGPEFAERSTFVMKALVLGVFFNAFGSVASSFIQGTGHPELTARVHLWELPIYLVALVLLTQQLGINGAAIAWAARVAVDAVIMQFIAWRILRPQGAIAEVFKSGIRVAPMFAALIAGSMVGEVMEKTLILVAALPAFAIIGWRSLLTCGDRAWVKRCFANLLAKLK